MIYRNWPETVQMPKNPKPAEGRTIPAQPSRAAFLRRGAPSATGIVRAAASAGDDATAASAGDDATAAVPTTWQTLGSARIRDGEVFVRTIKNRKPVRLPVHSDAARDALPLPAAVVRTEILELGETLKEVRTFGQLSSDHSQASRKVERRPSGPNHD
jgi:hypothetical protein